MLNERIVERRVHINSADRDIMRFPSPFNMQTSFGNSNIEPNIDEDLTNIKYITLNSVIVPRTIAIDTSLVIADPFNLPQNIYPTSSLYSGTPPTAVNNSDPYHDLFFSSYLMLRIKELSTRNQMGSSSLFKRDTFMLILDQRLNDMCLFKPTRNTVIYPNSLLHNLNILTFELMDSKGKKIELVDHNGKKIIGQNNTISPDVPYDYNEYVRKYKDDNSSVLHTDCSTQVIYDFTFGIIENELNTQTNYNKL